MQHLEAINEVLSTLVDEKIGVIKNYDEILVVGDGKIVNHGTFEHLYNTCEYFKEICDIKILA